MTELIWNIDFSVHPQLVIGISHRTTAGDPSNYFNMKPKARIYICILMFQIEFYQTERQMNRVNTYKKERK